MANAIPDSWSSHFSWPHRYLGLISNALSLIQKKVEPCAQKVLLTTSFSGVGTAEFSAEAALNACSSFSNSDKAHLVPYCCCDFNKHCRAVLRNQECQHVFQSTCDSFPPAVINSLRSVVHEARKKYVAICLQSPQFKNDEALNQLGSEVSEKCARILKGVKPKQKCWCERHSSFCNRFPSRTELLDAIWIETSGSPCIPWTPAAYGSGLKWLHEDVSVSFWAWLYSILNGENIPDALLHENVPGFDLEGMCKHHMPDSYVMQTFVLSPADVGFPAARPRRYTLFLRKDHVPLLGFSLSNWQDIFGSQLQIDATVLLNADEVSLEDLKKTYSSRRHLPSKPAGKDASWSWESLLSPSQYRIVRNMREKVSEHDLASRPSHWFCNVSQSMDFQPRFKPVLTAPTLMTSSRLWIDSSEKHRMRRLIHPLELFAMQGLPVFMSSNLGKSTFEESLRLASLPETSL